jgi:flagellar biosynthetic protein FlhB
VAEVLAYVYQLRRYREYGVNAMAGRKAPVPPATLAVPADMDPQNDSSSASSI